MQLGEASCDLPQDGLRPRDVTETCSLVLHRASEHELHHEERGGSGSDTDVDDRHDVGVRDLARPSAGTLRSVSCGTFGIGPSRIEEQR